MFKQVLFSALMLVSCAGQAQTADTIYRHQVKFSVFRALNVLNPRIELAYERWQSDKFSIQFSAGIPSNVVGSPFENLRGYIVGLEEKYFFSRVEKKATYLSVELNNSKNKYEEVTHGVNPITSVNEADNFTIVRKTTSLAFKYGFPFYTRRSVVDLNVGLGVKYRSVKHYDRIYDYSEPREFGDLHHRNNMEKEGFDFHMPFNLQLGYRFNFK
jgi:hypothetical protein